MRLASIFLFGVSAFAAGSAPKMPQAPVHFEPNQGQMARPVLWQARGLGYSIGFTRDATLLQMGSRTVTMRLRGQNNAAPFEAAVPFAAPTNYLTSAYRGTVPNYGRLRRRQVYPGIDVVYYGTGNQVEYDFEIAAGADPSRIRMSFTGADQLSLSPAGDLVLKLGDQNLTQHVPVVYQRNSSGERKVVPASYRIASNHDVTVALSHFDSTTPLVIDPTISFAAYPFGSGADSGISIASDAKGFVYLAGNTSSPDYPATGAVTANKGGQDVFVMKINPAATSGDQVIVYCSYYGGAAQENLGGMTIDSNGLIYIAGSTTSTDLLMPATAFKGTNAGTTDGFLAVFAPAFSGTDGILYATYLGGTGIDEILALTVFGGKIYVTGDTISNDFPVVNAFRPARAALRDLFVSEIDPTLTGTASLVASTYFGGSGSDYGRAIAVDAPGHVFVAGQTYSADYAMSPAPLLGAYAGGGDGFLTEFFLTSASGGYSSYFGGSGIDDIRKIVIDPAGRVALTGYTSSADFPVTQNAEQPLLGGTGAFNAFLTILDTKAAGPAALIYSTYYGGSVAEAANDLKLDASGKYYLGGYSLSPDLPVSQNALNPVSAKTGLNGFIAVINPAAPPVNALTYASYVTGPGSQVVNGLDVDAGGTIYATGYATSDVFPAGYQSHPSGDGNADMFILVFKP